MYEVTPGNYWFGKKWYHIKTQIPPQCPDNLTEGTSRFINQNGDIDPGLLIKCLDEGHYSASERTDKHSEL